MARLSKNHPHKYKRKWLGKNKDYEVYVCILPGCRHYVQAEMLEGKEYICWRCGHAQVATVATRLLARPHCKDCTKTKGGKPKKERTNFKQVGHLPEIDLSDLV
jgi:hypothetical protein